MRQGRATVQRGLDPVRCDRIGRLTDVRGRTRVARGARAAVRDYIGLNPRSYSTVHSCDGRCALTGREASEDNVRVHGAGRFERARKWAYNRVEYCAAFEARTDAPASHRGTSCTIYICNGCFSV